MRKDFFDKIRKLALDDLPNHDGDDMIEKETYYGSLVSANMIKSKDTMMLVSFARDLSTYLKDEEGLMEMGIDVIPEAVVEQEEGEQIEQEALAG